MGTLAGALAGPGDRGHAGHGGGPPGCARARRGGWRGRTNPGCRAPRRRARPRVGHRHLAGDPAPRQGGGRAGRAGECGHPGTRRRAPRPVARRLLRRCDFTRRPDLLSRPAAGAGRHPPCPQAGRALRRSGVFHRRPQPLLRAAGRHHPAPRAAATAPCWRSQPETQAFVSSSVPSMRSSVWTVRRLAAKL